MTKRRSIAAATLSIVGLLLLVIASWNFIAGMEAADAGYRSGSLFDLGIGPLGLLGLVLLVAGLVSLLRRPSPAAVSEE
jgi:hypothetical protein